MQLHTLESKVRSTGRKGMNTEARKDGGIPSVLYGGDADNMNIVVNRRALEKILHQEGGAHALIQLQFTEMAQCDTPAIIKAVQRHPVSDVPQHVDFMRIRLDEMIQSPVAIVLSGRPKGVIDGGVIDHQLREVMVECLALDIPEHIEIDITSLGMGKVSRIGPASRRQYQDHYRAGLAVASIHAPRVVKAAEQEAETKAETESEGKADAGKEAE